MCSFLLKSIFLILLNNLGDNYLVSCNLISATKNIFVNNSSNESSVKKFGKSFPDADNEDQGTVGDYFKLTNSHVFDIEDNILGKSLHITSPKETRGQESSEGLVIVPSFYDEVVSEKEETDLHKTRNRDSIKYHYKTKNSLENQQFAIQKGKNHMNMSYYNHLIKTVPNLLERIKSGVPKPKNLVPLFLTPYINSGQYREGQKLATVKPFVGNIRSYAGYLTVDQRFHSNLFFWYFPCERPDSHKRPVLLWLQGGPGVSSLFALFYENGPYKFVKGKIHKDNNSWSKEYNVVYIDNPVGTGFSFTTPQGYARNQTIIGQHLYEALKQFFHLFPELQNNDFYITGESYAGKYIPSIAYEIHQRNLLSHFRIHLKGLFIGNGWIDPISMLEYSEFLFHLGYLDEEQRNIIAGYEDTVKLQIRTEDWEAAALYNDILETSLHNMTGFSQLYNMNGLDFDLKDFELFVNDVTVRERIHVGLMKFNDFSEVVSLALRADIMQSVLHKVNVLVENYRIVFYYGQLDLICPYRLGEPFFRNIQFKHAYDYHKAERQIWTHEREDDQDNVIGYIKEAHNMVEVLIRNAGHMVPHDQPRFMMDLLEKYIDK